MCHAKESKIYKYLFILFFFNYVKFCTRSNQFRHPSRHTNRADCLQKQMDPHCFLQLQNMHFKIHSGASFSMPISGISNWLCSSITRRWFLNCLPTTFVSGYSSGINDIYDDGNKTVLKYSWLPVDLIVFWEYKWYFENIKCYNVNSKN